MNRSTSLLLVIVGKALPWFTSFIQILSAFMMKIINGIITTIVSLITHRVICDNNHFKLFIISNLESVQSIQIQIHWTCSYINHIHLMKSLLLEFVFLCKAICSLAILYVLDIISYITYITQHFYHAIPILMTL